MRSSRRGLDRLVATSDVLQRARIADPDGGLWEAADVQWWWRRPRPTDELELPVWSDGEDRAVAAVALTDWGTRTQLDALVVPDTAALDEVWDATVDAAEATAAEVLEVLAREDDEALLRLLVRDGFTPTDERSGVTWLVASDRPPVTDVPEGFVVVDRARRSGDGARPHPMRVRNGDEVEARLAQCPLYDPWLDLAVETVDGDDAGYALFWFDAATGVGMLEPMRVEDAYQRRGLARALLTEGLDRLARRGARRLKVGFDGEAGKALYLGAGFEVDAMVRSFTRARR